MALTDKKLSTYTDNVKSLSDYPSDDGVTAEQLKAIFDGRTDKEVKNAVNGIIDELTATTGAGQIKAASGDSVQAELNAHASSISGKVDKVAGKGLSTNDYTTAEKNKLSGIETGANKTIVDSAISDTSENPVQNKEVKRLLDAKVNKNAPNVDTPILIQGEDPTGIYEPVGKITVDEHELSIIHESATLPLSPALIIGGNSLRYKEDGVEYDVYTENNKPPVDAELSDTSENPLQNKVVKSAIDEKADKTSVNELKNDIAEMRSDSYAPTGEYENKEVEIVAGEAINKSGKIVAWSNSARTVMISVKEGETYKVTGRGLSTYVCVAFYSSTDSIGTSNFVSWENNYGSYIDQLITIPDGVRGMVVSTAQSATYGNPKVKSQIYASKIPDLEERLERYNDDSQYEIQQLQRRVLKAEKGNDFAWGEFDKPYFVFIQDDLNNTVADYVAVFNAKNVPMGQAVIPNRISDKNVNVLRSVVENGGEILAHYIPSLTDYNTDAEWLACTRDAKKTIESYGFEVRGLIRAGNTAKSSYKGEKYCRLYFDYADDKMGQSIQYDLPRIGVWNFSTIDALKARIDWESESPGIHAYGFHGVSPDKAWTTPEAMGEIIDYITAKGNCAITTYSALFDAFGTTVLEKRLSALESN